MKKAITTLLAGIVTLFFASTAMAKVKPIEIPLVSQKTNPDAAKNLEAVCTTILKAINENKVDFKIKLKECPGTNPTLIATSLIATSEVKIVCEAIQGGETLPYGKYTHCKRDLLDIMRKNDIKRDYTIEVPPKRGQKKSTTLTYSEPIVPPGGAKAVPVTSAAVGSYESMIIQGMADFIVKRAKAELVFMLQDSLQRDLCSEGQYADFFPNTCKILASVTETSSIQSMGAMLQKSAEKDIEQLPDTVLGDMAMLYLYFDSRKENEIQTISSKLASAEEMLSTAEAILSSAEEKISTAESKLSLAEPYISTAEDDLDYAAKSLEKLQSEFKDDKNPFGRLIMDSSYTDIQDAKKYLRKPLQNANEDVTKAKEKRRNDVSEAIRRIKLAQGKMIRDGDNYKKLAETFTAARIGLAFYRESRNGRSPLDIIRGLSELKQVDCEDNDIGKKCEFPKLVRRLAIGVRGFENAANISNEEVNNYEAAAILLSIAELREKLKYTNKFILPVSATTTVEFELNVNSVSISDFAAAMNGIKAKVIDIADTTDQLKKTGSKDEALGEGEKMQLRIKIARLGVDIICNFLDSGIIVTTPNSDEVKDLLKPISLVLDFGSNYLNHDNAGMIISATNLITELDEQAGNPLPKEVTQYLPLLVQVASAKSSEDVASVLEAAAAPVGSYRGKYESFSVSVTALFGISGGGEYLLGDVNEWRGVGSLFSPVGVTMTWPYKWDFGSKWFGKGYWGPMVSVIDFGPYLTAGEEGKDFKVPSNLQFKNIFSPGLYLIWNPFFNYPIVFGLGGSYNTNLRLDAKGKEVSVARGQAFIAADLTLFPLGNHMKKHRKKK